MPPIIPQVSLNQKQLLMQFFSQHIQKCFQRRESITVISDALRESTVSTSFVTPYKSAGQLFEKWGIPKKSNDYQQSFTALKKLGLILKHNNKYCINPLYNSKSTHQTYQLAIEYYNLLFAELDLVVIGSGEDQLEVSYRSLEDLKSEAIDKSYFKWVDKRNDLIYMNNALKERDGLTDLESQIQPKSYDEVYAIAFSTAKTSTLPTSEQRIRKSVNELYRRLCEHHLTHLILKHIEILEEQGIVGISYNPTTRQTSYTFNRLTQKFQKTMPFYNDTKAYQDNLPPSIDDVHGTSEGAQQGAQELFDEVQEEVHAFVQLEEDHADMPDNIIKPSRRSNYQQELSNEIAKRTQQINEEFSAKYQAMIDNKTYTDDKAEALDKERENLIANIPWTLSKPF